MRCYWQALTFLIALSCGGAESFPPDTPTLPTAPIRAVYGNFSGYRVLLPILWDARAHKYCAISAPTTDNRVICNYYDGGSGAVAVLEISP